MYFDKDLPTSWVFRFIEKLPAHNQSTSTRLLRYGFALLMVAVAYGLRELIGPPELGLPALTFFFAAALSAIFGGFGPGLLAGVIGGFLSTYLYMPPYRMLPFEFAAGTVWINAVYCVNVTIVCVAMQSIHKHFIAYREANQRLSSGRRLLQSIIEGTTDTIYIKDLDGCYRLVNGAAANFIGKSAEQVLGQKDTFIFPEQEASLVSEEDRSVICLGKVHSYEHTLTAANGEKHVFLTTKGPLFNEHGQITGIFGIDRDITSHKKAEICMLEKLAVQDQLVKIAESVPGVICSFKTRTDGSYCFPYASHALSEIFVCSPEAVREDATAILALIHPDDVTAIRASKSSSEKKLEAWHSVFRVCHPQKGEIWIEGSGLPIKQTDGSTLWHGYLQDITDKRRAEAQMRLAAGVFDMAAEGVVVTDANKRILTVNSTFTRLTGYTHNDAVGQTMKLLQSGRHDQAFYTAMWESLGKKGHWQGEIWSRRKNGEIYLEWLSINAVKAANDQITHYIGVFRDITIVKSSQERMDFLATHDELTALPNRVLLNDRLHLAVNRAKRAGTNLALLMVDLDDFKMINDTLGHELGDALLKQTAQRLCTCVRAEDTVARMGGDEFVILLDSADRTTASNTAERIVQSLSESYKFDEHEYFVSASIGISFFPDDATEHSNLLRNADTAMYRAKEQGKNSFKFFCDEMAERTRNRLDIEKGLRQAIKNQELYLEYQPQINMRSNALVGAEALIRWRRDGKVVPPMEFIPVAEETHLIIDIGEWVVAEACRQLLEWDRAGFARFTVSVNISARHFRQADMVSRIQTIVLAAGIEPHRLCLEITEGAIENVEAAMSMLTQLHAFGFETSVDDFGTGFSSLSHLKRFPIHELKVDRSFVNGIVNDRDDKAITSAIISMARNLELRVVAEGVENEEQLRALQLLDCDVGQGYFYSRPLSAAVFDTWIRDRN